MAQRFVACDKALSCLRGVLVAGREKEGARRLRFLINGDSVSSHDHGFSNSLIIHRKIQRKLMFNECLEIRQKNCSFLHP